LIISVDFHLSSLATERTQITDGTQMPAIDFTPLRSQTISESLNAGGILSQPDALLPRPSDPFRRGVSLKNSSFWLW